MTVHKLGGRLVAFAAAAALAIPLGMLTIPASAEDGAARADSTTQMSSTPEVVYTNRVESGQSRTTDFDANWKFKLSDSIAAESPDYDDSAWQQISLPHDYSITQDYTQSGEAESAYLPGGTGWYRKTFTLDKGLAGRQVSINFDGVYMNATVWLNGVKLGEHPYGYSPFSFDLTKNAKFGAENTIVVKVDHKTPSSRFYSGSGIYRDVTLTVTDSVHVAGNGVAVKTPQLAEQHNGNVTMNLTATVANDTDKAASVTLKQTVFTKGKPTETLGTVTTAAQSVDAGKSADVASTITTTAAPKLWGVDAPNLYTVRTEVQVGGKTVDTYDTDYGFRWTSFDPDTGFSINGVKTKLKGVSMHHDQGSLGSVANKAAIARQVRILKDMGVNSIRTTHNTAAKAFIDICNEQGILVIEEIFDGWNRAKNGNTEDYAKYFDKTIASDNQILGGDKDESWAKFDLTSTINRDRNDPSIIMWSTGNEMMEGISGSVADFPNISAKLTAWAKAADDTREVTYGDNKIKAGWSESNTMGDALTAAGGVVGANYENGSLYDSTHKAHPTWKLYGSETASSINSRGIYNVTSGQTSGQQLTSYDNYAVGWGATASSAWYDVIQRDFVAGEYVWTGFDYLGEPTPWNGTDVGVKGTWPSPKNSYFGIVDTAGLPKDSYYFYRSQWNTKSHTLHVLPAWNGNVVAKDSSGKVPVVVYTDAAKVKLYFTPKGSTEKKLIGEKQFTEHTTDVGYTYKTYDGDDKNTTADKNMYLTWNVPWAEGTISAEAFDKDGNQITNAEGRSSVTTTGAASQLKAEADRTEIAADGKDLSYITVDVTDKDGNTIPDATDRVTFKVDGPGKLVGVDNGKTTDHQSYQDDNRQAFSGKLIAIVQSTKTAGSIKVTATADGLKAATTTITTTAVPGTGTAKTIDGVYYSRNYYVKTGNKPTLPSDVEVRYSDGTKDRQNVTWNEVTDEQVSKPGTFAVTGTVADQTITVRVTMIDEGGALLNYSATTPLGTAPALPESRPLVLSDGTVTSANFAVTWKKPADAEYAKAGTVTVPGTATVFDKTVDVTATIRVQKASVAIGDSVSGNAMELTQSIPTESQSDTLDAIKDGSTTVSDNLSGGANPTAWTNWAWSKAGNKTAQITFEYATQQTLGQIVMYFFRDSSSVTFPDAGTTKIEVSDNGTDWTQINAKETIATAESSDRVKPYTYDFAPTGATFIRFTVTNADTTTSSGVVSTGLTEIELKLATTSFTTNTAAGLASLKVNGTAVSESALASGSYNTPALKAEVEATGKDNASVTVVPAYNGKVHVITESEDHATRETFVINLGKEQPDTPDSDARDYPADDMTITVGSEQKPGTSNEGPKEFVKDGNVNTYWHSNWTATTINDLWIAFELKEPTKLDALRYLPRPSGSKNGSVTEYKLQISDNGTDWTDAGSGTWETDYGWKIAQFTQPVTTKHVRLQAVHTYADSGMDKFMSAAEIRLRTAKETADIAKAEVTVPAELTVDKVDADHPAEFAEDQIVVKLGETTLRNGIDYVLEYAGNTAADTAKVTIKGIDKYTGSIEKTFTIKVNETKPEPAKPTLEAIYVKTAPKQEYTEGDTLDVKGLVLTLAYSDKSEKTVAYGDENAKDFTFKPALGDKLATGDKSVTVTYQGKTTTYDITVSKKTPTVNPDNPDPDPNPTPTPDPDKPTDARNDLQQTVAAYLNKNLNASNYTQDSWAVYVAALKNAQLKLSQTGTSDADLTKALNELNAAYGKLVRKGDQGTDTNGQGGKGDGTVDKKPGLSDTGATVAAVAAIAAIALAAGVALTVVRRRRA